MRDLGEAHVVALEKEAAGGERMIVRAGVFAYQKWDDLSMKTMLTISSLFTGQSVWQDWSMHFL